MLHRRTFALALVAALILSACGGKKHASAKPNTVAAANDTQELKVGTTDVSSYGPDVKIGGGQKTAALDVAQKYVNTAILAPLANGPTDAGFNGLFEPSLQSAVTGPDADALTDGNVGKLKKFSQTATPVTLSALVDGAGNFLYLATKFTVKVTGDATDGAVTLTHDVELTLNQTGNNWLVTAYRVTTTRALPAGTTTTVANSGGNG